MIALALSKKQGRLGEPAAGAPAVCPDETGTMIALTLGGAIVGTIAGVVVASFWPSKREGQHHQEINRLQRLLDERGREFDRLQEEYATLNLRATLMDDYLEKRR